MFSKQTKIVAYFIIIICLTLGLSISLQSILAAWNAPTVAPPGSNVSELINISNAVQVKSGSLGIGGNLMVDNNTFFVDSVNHRVGIGLLSPTTVLDVAGTGRFASMLTLGDANPTILQSSRNATAGSQIILANTYAPTIGSRYSGADAFLASNAFQTTNTADAWAKGAASYSSNIAILGLTTTNNGTAFQVRNSPPSTAAGQYNNVFPNSLLTVLETGNVGIGTTNPGAKLEVAGQIKITGGIPGNGKVLTSDASGLASWKTPANSSFDQNVYSCPFSNTSLNYDTITVCGSKMPHCNGQTSLKQQCCDSTGAVKTCNLAGKLSTETCNANYNTTCTSAANSCGATATGVYLCDGICGAVTPDNPAGYGSTCYSAPNACGQTNTGTIGCSGCTATTPSNPPGYGSSCSRSNTCLQVNYGSILCNGLCSVAAPPESNCGSQIVYVGFGTGGTYASQFNTPGCCGQFVTCSLSCVKGTYYYQLGGWGGSYYWCQDICQ